jgi:hypothetical protein
METRATRVAAAALATALMFALSGCGGASGGPALYSVHGQVTFDGKPVEEGRILFRMEGDGGKSYSGAITNGAYQVEAEAGKAVVEITATRDTGKVDDMGGAAEPVPIKEQYIPAQYNSETTLSAEVTSGSNLIPFDLKPM